MKTFSRKKSFFQCSDKSEVLIDRKEDFVEPRVKTCNFLTFNGVLTLEFAPETAGECK